MVAPPKEKPKVINTPLDAMGFVKLNKSGTLELILKLFLKKIRYVKIERGFLEDQIVALRAELEKCKNTGSQPITPSPVTASPDHTGLGDFFQKPN